MTIKFRQKNAKIAHILVLYMMESGDFARTIKFSGLSNLNMLSEFFRELMAKINQNCNKLGDNLQITFVICVQRICLRVTEFTTVYT